jgi:hypothetical protein
MIASIAPDIEGLSSHTVLLGEGIPTKEELLVYYPAKFTWKQLKTFVNSGYSGFHVLYLWSPSFNRRLQGSWAA